MKLDQTKDNFNLCKILFLQFNSIYRFETRFEHKLLLIPMQCKSNAYQMTLWTC